MRRRGQRRAAPWWVAALLLLCAAGLAAGPWRCLLSTVPLLGGAVAWRLNEWREVTDVARGGSSVASLKGATMKAAEGAGSSIGAEFSGRLGPSEAAGAFAGVSLNAQTLPHPIDKFKGLRLDVAQGDGQQYSIALQVLGAPAGTLHEFQFQAPDGDHAGDPLELPFRDFVPMVRGKPPVGPSAPLRLDRVANVMLRIQAGKGDAERPFSLVLRSFAGIPGVMEKEPEAPARTTRWACDACGMLNFNFATQCQRCGSPRAVREVIAKAQQAAEEKAKATKWTCSGCGAINFKSALECRKCGAPQG